MISIWRLSLLLATLTAAVIISASPAADRYKQPFVKESWFCPAGWTEKWNARKCYKVVSTQRSWKKSLDMCSSFGGHLAIVDSENTQEFLTQLLHNNLLSGSGAATYAWIGLTRIITPNANTANSVSDYEWAMDQKMQNNYKIGYFRALGNNGQTPETVPIFTSHSISQLKWVQNEPSFEADNCGAMMILDRTSREYFDKATQDGRAVDLPCNNVPRLTSQPANGRVSAAVCEIQATNLYTYGGGDNEHASLPDAFAPVIDDVGAGGQPDLALVPQQYWLNNTVPFALNAHSKFSDEEKGIIYQILREVQNDAANCVQFIERDNETDFINFGRLQDASCTTEGVGRLGGQQAIDLGPICFDYEFLPQIKRLVLHALGMPFEQMRWDRDSHISILWDNIEYRGRGQFQKINRLLPVWDGFEYDIDSLMHFPDDAFSFIPGKLKTIIAKTPADRETLKNKAMQLASRNSYLSEMDRAKLKKLYCDQPKEKQQRAAVVEASSVAEAPAAIAAPQQQQADATDTEHTES